MKKEKKNKKDEIVFSRKRVKSLLLKILLPIVLVIAFFTIVINIVLRTDEGKIFTVKNESHFNKLLSSEEKNKGIAAFFLSPLYYFLSYNLDLEDAAYNRNWGIMDDGFVTPPFDVQVDVPASMRPPTGVPMPIGKGSAPSSGEVSSPSTDYSKTNVQVEDIDEADIVKTDGGYVYSLLNDKVVITNVLNKKDPKVVARIQSSSPKYPTDIIVQDNMLVIISTDVVNWRSDSNMTAIEVYDITNKSEPTKVKGLEIPALYARSRVANNQVYIFSQKEIYRYNFENIREYTENFKEKEIAFSNIKYIKPQQSNTLTYMISFDLKDIDNDAKISMYFMDFKTTYMSHQNLYFFDTNYSKGPRRNTFLPELKEIFKWGGAFGRRYDYFGELNVSKKQTKVFKYGYMNGEIEFINNTTVDGGILNQYACDEKDGNLRIALHNSKGTRIKVLDPELKEIGDTGPVAPGEDNKSVRFTGNRAYFVTFKQVDPLYVVDLSNPTDPRIMGELKIPGFSSYLHPYDDNHIVGIGPAIREVVNRDRFGKPISETVNFDGMKMTMFDISDMKNPKEKDVAYFGNARTDSAINTEPKALLFSKEKNLIAIPVNKMGMYYPMGKPVVQTDPASTAVAEDQPISSFIIPEKNFINQQAEEGYIIYNITTDGFKFKGLITHDLVEKKTEAKFNEDNIVRSPIRGLYIDSSLITVSYHALKINDLDTLKFISNIKLEEDKKTDIEIGKTYISEDIWKAE